MKNYINMKIATIIMLMSSFSAYPQENEKISDSVNSAIIPAEYVSAEVFTARRIQSVLTRLRNQETTATTSEETRSIQKNGEISTTISDEQAIEIAKQAIGQIVYDENGKIIVERYDDIIRVIFPFDLPRGARGPGFAAEVFLNAFSGNVLFTGADAD